MMLCSKGKMGISSPPNPAIHPEHSVLPGVQNAEPHIRLGRWNEKSVVFFLVVYSFSDRGGRWRNEAKREF